MACGSASPSPAAPAPAPPPDLAASFCDARPEDTLLVPPPLAGGATLPDAPGWRWLNAWATWCAPCVEELPRIVAWRDTLVAEGVPVDVRFVAFDRRAADVERFLRRRPDLTFESLRIRSQEDVEAWFTALGLSASTAIPLHLFVDPAGRVRCVRARAVHDGDLDAIRQILDDG